MLKVEVRTAFGTAGRWRRVRNCRCLIGWRDQSDLDDIGPMGARGLNGLSIIKGIMD